MRIDFGSLPDTKLSAVHGGNGEMTARIYEVEGLKVMPCRLHPGGSIGMHRHEDGDEIIYVLYGNGTAVCDGAEEVLAVDTCHICRKGSEHSIANTGMTDLVMLTAMVER